jgi:hypothetical protein
VGEEVKKLTIDRKIASMKQGSIDALIALNELKIKDL